MPTTLVAPNGMCLLVEELPHTHSVSIGCFVGVGACYEPAPLSGVSHLIEHMCFKGTHHIATPRAISTLIEGVGGILDAATSYESTVFWAKVADIHFDRALHVLSELVCHPRFDPRELEKERRVIIEEIRGLQDAPDEWIHTLIQQSLWGEQPLGRDIAGSVESVRAISHAAMLHFWQQHYNPQHMVVSVAGNVQADRIAEAVFSAFASHPAGPRPQPIPTSPSIPGPKVTFLLKDTEQGNFCLGFPALSYTDPNRRAMDVLDTILGGGAASRLFQELREERGLAYNIGSYHNKYADAGLWAVYGSVDPETLHDTIATVLSMLRDVISTGITEDELQHVKEQVKGGMLISLEDTWSVASRNGSLQLRYGDVIPIEQVVAEIEAVTRDDVLRVARQILHPAGLHLAVIAPAEASTDLPALLDDWRL